MPAQKILSEAQWELLLDYMEANPTFAKGVAGVRSGQETKELNNTQWKRLACRLNNVGSGCIKNYGQWREYWNNAKYKARKKACTIWKQMRGTPNGEPLHRYFLLTKIEKRVLTSLGIPIPGQVHRMKIKSPPASATPDGSQSPPDASLPQCDMSPPATPSLDIPTQRIKAEPDSPCFASPLNWVPLERKGKGLGIPIPGQVHRMKIKSPPASPAPDVSQSPPDASLPQCDMSPPATPSPDIPTRRIKAEPDLPCFASPFNWVPLERKDTQAAPPAPEWVRDIEERRIAAEERSARALHGIHANTESCVNALQGIQYAQECLNKTMQGIQAALEASARALQERRN